MTILKTESSSLKSIIKPRTDAWFQLGAAGAKKWKKKTIVTAVSSSSETKFRSEVNSRVIRKKVYELQDFGLNIVKFNNPFRISDHTIYDSRNGF